MFELCIVHFEDFSYYISKEKMQEVRNTLTSGYEKLCPQELNLFISLHVYLHVKSLFSKRGKRQFRKNCVKWIILKRKLDTFKSCL